MATWGGMGVELLRDWSAGCGGEGLMAGNIDLYYKAWACGCGKRYATPEKAWRCCANPGDSSRVIHHVFSLSPIRLEAD